MELSRPTSDAKDGLTKDAVWEKYLSAGAQQANLFSNYSTTTMTGLLTFVRIFAVSVFMIDPVADSIYRRVCSAP